MSMEVDRSGRNEGGSGVMQEHTEQRVDEPPTKRNRKQPTESKKYRKPPSLPTSDVSDEDRQKVVSRTPHKSPKANSSPLARKPRRANRRVVASPDFVSPSDEDDNAMHGSLFGSPVPSDNDNDVLVGSSLPKTDKTAEKPLSSSTSTPGMKKPSHRLAKPLVRLIDEPYKPIMGGAIAVKARITGQRTLDSDVANEPQKPSDASPSRPRPGPGRLPVKNKSSLLTFEKGTLKTVKGRYVRAERMIRDEPEVISTDPSDIVPATQSTAPPEPSELLQLAGIDTNGADTLPSYEESVLPHKADESSSEKPPERQGHDRLQRFVQLHLAFNHLR
jgi:hypothetical protein